MATLARYTGLSERTVRTCLDRLEAEGIISPCDPGIVAAWIKRADRRPQGWDLNLSLVRDDLDDAGVAALEHQFPGLGIRLAAAAQPGTDGQSDGVQPLHPVAGDSEAVDNRPNGVQQLHPASDSSRAASAHAAARFPAAVATRLGGPVRTDAGAPGACAGRRAAAHPAATAHTTTTAAAAALDPRMPVTVAASRCVPAVIRFRPRAPRAPGPSVAQLSETQQPNGSDTLRLAHLVCVLSRSI